MLFNIGFNNRYSPHGFSPVLSRVCFAVHVLIMHGLHLTINAINENQQKIELIAIAANMLASWIEMQLVTLFNK